jgi:zinc D-Ala-D-Ala dipeptidase
LAGIGALDAARAAKAQWGDSAQVLCWCAAGPEPAGTTAMRSTPILTAAILLALAAPAAAQKLPAGFVYLRDVDASIGQDIRYAGDNNFTGRALPGYGAPECVLRRDVALALRAAQTDLAKQNLSLKVYDCYRPARAVRAMWRWAHDGARDGDKRFYPRVRKLELFSLGYIAAHSAHSSGTAIDLTLVPRNAAPAPAIEQRTTYAPCTAPAAQRTGDNSIDMGTGFDCLDEKSRTASGSITSDQKRARGLLNAVMRAHGFHNYFREWWHFSFGPRPTQGFDFPVPKR